MYKTVGVVLACLNCYAHIVFVVFSLLLVVSHHIAIFACLSVSSSCLLAATIITAQLITNDSHALRQKEQVAYHQAGILTETGDCFRHIHNYVCINLLQYLRVRILYLKFCAQDYLSLPLLLVNVQTIIHFMTISNILTA